MDHLLENITIIYFIVFYVNITGCSINVRNILALFRLSSKVISLMKRVLTIRFKREFYGVVG